jgi:DNA-binding MarR family transcriptional regulator
MRELAHDPRHLERLHALVSGAGLTPGLAKALGRIPLDTPVAMRELASLLHCDSSYITSVVDTLERHGLAERRPHPTARRIRVVALTPAGERLVRQVRSEMATPPPAFDALNPEEADQLRALLRKLHRAGHEQPDPLPMAGS